MDNTQSPYKNIERLIAAGKLEEAFKRFGEFVQECIEVRSDLLQSESRFSSIQNQLLSATTASPEASIERNRITLNFLTVLDSFRRKTLSQYFDVTDKEGYFESLTSRDQVIEQILDLRLRPKRYQRVSQMKEGNSSIIYRLINPDTKRHATCMVLKLPTLTEGMKKEIQQLVDLRHRNIIKLIDYELEAYPYFIILEYIYGPTLEEALEKTGPRPAAQVVDWLYQLSDAVDYLRQKRLLHTNLRPSKIFIDDEWQIMLSPFDLHKATTGEHTFKRYLDVCRYGSPEFLFSDGKDLELMLMPGSDQYSIGLLAYKMLTGKELFEGQSVYDILEDRKRFIKDKGYRKEKFDVLPNDKFIGLDGKRHDLHQILKRLLAEDPTERYADMHKLLRALHPLTRAENPGTGLARASYRRCMAVNKEFIRDFYGHLHEKYPETLTAFNPIGQKRQSAMLQMAIDVLLDIESKKELFYNLVQGPAHQSFSIGLFAAFLDVLIDSLRRNDRLWNDVTEQAWQNIQGKAMEIIGQAKQA